MSDRLRSHFEQLPAGGPSDVYADDAVLEFAHSGERLRGKANIDAAHGAYPGRPCTFEVHSVVCRGDLGVVEMTLRFAGTDPHRLVSVLELRDERVVFERRYIAEPSEPAAYRAAWVERQSPGEH
jgi:hypothetical protein